MGACRERVVLCATSALRHKVLCTTDALRCQGSALRFFSAATALSCSDVRARTVHVRSNWCTSRARRRITRRWSTKRGRPSTLLPLLRWLTPLRLPLAKPLPLSLPLRLPLSRITAAAAVADCCH